MRMTWMVCFLLFFGGAVNGATQDIPGEPQSVFSAEGWSAYNYKEGNETISFITKSPETSTGNYKQRGAASLKITYRGTIKKNPEISFTAGYTYLKESDVHITIGKTKATLFTQEDTAWAADEKADEQILKALLKGQELIIEGTSSKGTKTKDTFKLTGLKAALDQLRKASDKTS